jgi:hypothetical protein
MKSIPGFDSQTFFDASSIQKLANGDIKSIQFNIFMNSDANVDLQDDPAFALSHRVVEAGGDELSFLFAFTNSKFAKPEDFKLWATIVNKKQYVAPYVIVSP